MKQQLRENGLMKSLEIARDDDETDVKKNITIATGERIYCVNF